MKWILRPKEANIDDRDGLVLNLKADLEAIKLDSIRLGSTGAALRKLLGKPEETRARILLHNTALATIALKPTSVEIQPTLSRTGYIDGQRIEYSCYLFALLLIKFLKSVASGVINTVVIVQQDDLYKSIWDELNALCQIPGSKNGEWSLEKLVACKQMIETYAADEIRNLKSYDLIGI
jgi:hypothetical protein